MPAKDQLDPDSVRTRIRVWLATHPGWHDTKAVAQGVLGADVRPADKTALVRELSRMARSGEGVASHRPADTPARGPGTKYAQAGTRPPATV